VESPGAGAVRLHAPQLPAGHGSGRARGRSRGPFAEDRQRRAAGRGETGAVRSRSRPGHARAQRQEGHAPARAARHAARRAAQPPRPHRREEGVRSRDLRRVHRADGRQGGLLLHGPRHRGAGAQDRDGRGARRVEPGHRRDAALLRRERRAAMRLLHARLRDGVRVVPAIASESCAKRGARGPRRQPLPLRHLPRRHAGGPRRDPRRQVMELAWPDPKDTTVLGKRILRLDGPDKTTGRAKYTYDTNRPRMLWAKYATCPHGHARVKSVDVDAAQKMAGVVAIEVLAPAGSELNVAFSEVAIVAAESEEVAREAVRRIQVEYEVLPHNVVDDDPQLAGASAKPGKANVAGDPDAAFKEAAAVSETEVGCSIITHCCMESHGSAVEVAADGKSLTAWCSTQAISG